MIISGGFNVYPKEVEDVIARHPAVSEVAVFGMPDPRWGEAVTAAITLREGFEATAEEIIAAAKAETGTVNAPKTVHFFSANLCRKRHWASLTRRRCGSCFRRPCKNRHVVCYIVKALLY